MYCSLENEKFDMFNKMLEKGVKIDSLCFLYAVKSKNIDVVNFLIKVKGTQDKYINNKIIEFAASEGDITFINEILKLNIYEKEKMNNLYNLAMSSAGEDGHIHVVKIMLVNGTNNYNDTMMNAAKGGFIDIVNLMLENGADNYNETMEKARGKNRFEIVKIMLERTKDKNTRIINKILSDAGKNGNYEIVKLMIENGATYFNECLFYSIRNNNYNIFETIIDKCDINKSVSYYSKRGYEKFVDKYIYHAAKVGNIKMVQKLLEKEGKECPKILKYAVKSGELFDFLTRQNIGSLDYIKSFNLEM
jgi:ankyrin repeat protein